MRRAARKGATQSSIVEGLRACGYDVTIINQEGLPDLLVKMREASYCGISLFMMLETKSKRKKDGTIALRKEQKKQNDFCALHRVPYVTTLQEAIDALES